MAVRHSLYARDLETMKAQCTVCATEVDIVKVGTGYGCRNAVRDAKRRYRKAHPDRARAHRGTHSPHRLAKRNGELDSCSVCGEVEPVAWGRGWMCPTIVKERNWTVTQTEPAPRCGRCNAWLIDNSCPRCERAQARALNGDFVRELYAGGMHLETDAAPLPTSTENAVPGWVTLGSTDRVKPDWPRNSQGYAVRPEYAALYAAK